ncbi:hypothetical protein LTR56_016212 [Elasticomyces elasticus]|nr:hypothetical protein LTR56_016212 [Elasticomyces elasticus]KAK3642171.1 hypothetical protein LTR22_016292 [Elasticomyces elasticus]KAK4914219.1 hypothetical protein LTR49_017572 [Elasticomyces elasticus]KAK5762580.1 hypothetical protein LTS12_007371 [Elasticomyces elasticus]
MPHSPDLDPTPAQAFASTECDSFLQDSAMKADTTDMEVAETSSVYQKTGRRNVASRWIQWRPILGLLALCIAIGCIFFTLAILIASDDAPVTTWAIQPTVYLAIAAALANSALSSAYAQATPIAWWYRLSRPGGATIRAMERQWQASQSLTRAAGQSQRMTLVIATSMLVAVMIVDGPLLQRASSVVVATQSQVVTLQVTLPPEVPTGFSGYDQYYNLMQSTIAVDVGQNWLAKSPISLEVGPRCEGTCTGTVQGPGLTKKRCITRVYPITDTAFHDPNATWCSQSEDFYAYAPYNFTNPIFYVGMDTTATDNNMSDATLQPLAETTWLGVGLMELLNGTGNYTETECWWIPAILEYNISIDSEHHVTIDHTSGSTGKLASLANNTQAPNNDEPNVLHQSTLAFIALYLGSYYRTSAVADFITNGSFWSPDTYQNAVAMSNTDFPNNINPFDIAFFDPTEDIINNFDDIMFRAAVSTADWPNITRLIDPGLSVNQTSSLNQTLTRNVFRSDFRWYAAASVLELIVILFVLPLFWGYWTLDRHLDLSPFSTALALNAPLLEDADQSRGVPGVLEKLGDVRIRYGDVVDEKTIGVVDGRSGSASSASTHISVVKGVGGKQDHK